MMRRGPRRRSAAGQARPPHRRPPQHLDQHGHPGRLVRGVRPRAVAPGRLRLVREHPHPRGASGLHGIGFELAGQIIWDKGLFSVGRSWYHWAHEPCVVVRRPGVPNLFIGERDQSTIWRAPSPKRIGGGVKEQKEDHPTQKPVLLSEIPIRNHLRPGEAVYEPSRVRARR